MEQNNQQPTTQQTTTKPKDAGQKVKELFRVHFTPYRIAYMAIFVALAFVVSLLDFPIFPQASFLKLDFGNVFILLIGFMFGPVEGIIVCVIKELLHIPFGSTGGVGELANILSTTCFILIPSIVYRFKKGLPAVILSLVAAILLNTAANLLINRYINFPLYGDTDGTLFNAVWYFIVFFNLIKGTVISVVTLFLYKPLHRLFQKISEK